MRPRLLPTCRSAVRRPRPRGCSALTPTRSPRPPPASPPRSTRSPRTTTALVAPSRRPPIRSSTCSPRCTPHGRTGSLPPDHNLDDYVDVPREHRHGPLRVGLGGPVGSGKTALAAALCRTLGAEYGL